jgi:outer membrane protein, multidrug efflux system
MRLYIFLTIICALIALQSCRTAKTDVIEIKKPLPTSFNGTTDSLNTASVGRGDFFSDENLRALIDTALINNQNLLTAYQRIEMSRAGMRYAKGAMLPNLNAYTAFNQRKFGLYTMDGAGNITTPIEGQKIVPIHLPDYYVGLQTSWEVDIWGKLRSRKVAALSRYLASVEGKNLVITNLISDVANSYYELLALDTELEVIQETIALQENALALITVQKEAGVANKLGVDQFEAQLLNTKALEKEVIQRIVEMESTINFLLGRYPQPISREKTALFSTSPFKINIGVPSDLLKYRPDVRQAEYEVLASKADLKSARAAFLPSFNITGAYGFQAYKTSYLFFTPESIAYSILGGLTAPLINRSAIKANFNVEKARQREALYNYQQSIINGYIEVYNEVSSIKTLSDVFELKSREAALLTESIETSSELFKARRATYLEVIVAQKNALQTKLELVDIKKRQFNASVNLYKALGGGRSN